MADKQYLDYAGLKGYDELIKNWVINHLPETTEGYDDSEIRSLIAEVENKIPAAYDDAALQAAMQALDEKVGADSVANQISAAIGALVNNAPSNLDTLKELADWINTHGESAAALVTTVAEQGEAIAAVNTKIDGITSISETYIAALFLEPVVLEDGQTVQAAIDSLEEGQKLVLNEDVTENLAITKDAVIEAEGVDFSGQINVNENATVTVIGATFSGEVVVVAE